jgi:putative ABC transport system permease protein
MRFSTFILKNLSRRPLRSLLTICALAVAIGAVVSLVGIAQGFEQTFLALYQKAGVDMVVSRAGGGRQRMTSHLDQKLGARIAQMPRVKEVLVGLVDMTTFPDLLGSKPVPLQGWEPESAVFNHLTILKGRTLLRSDTRAILLGVTLARDMEKSVGDIVEVVEKEPFEVVGIYESGNTIENGAIVLPLTELQRINQCPGQVTGFSLVLEEGRDEATLAEIRREIEALAPRLSAVPTTEFVKSLTEIRLAKAMALLTSCIALFIGFFGITNTMVMSVHERTREIGILRAVGWQMPRIIRMILMETVFLSILGALLGVLGAVLIVQGLSRVPTVNGVIDGRIQPIYLGYGFLIAVVLGLLGSVLPAIRATRMMPTEALRHE